ncbi:MAG: glycosyltransferase family 4 protein [Gemmatales bacterium]|nr:glycosyltransferase family 4 protein [Gemmatales bacterium]MDW8386318.1 glycosyltransferase family 4 protein [Gemmatales bacterium]
MDHRLKSPLKVLHLAVGKMYGGIESMLTTLARNRHFCPEVHQEVALCFPGQLRRNLEEAGVPVHDLGPVRFSRPWQVWRARHRLRQIIRQTQPDVVLPHGGWVYALGAPAARSCDVPVVLFAHAPPTRENWPDRLARQIRPTACIANSEFTARAVRDWYPGVPCQTVHCPVAPTAVADQASTRQAIRRELRTMPEAVVILYAARMEPGKGPDVLLRALACLKNQSSWVCWLAGSPGNAAGEAYLADLHRKADSFGIADRLRWLGHRNDVPNLLASADMLCQPNRLPDSFGIAFVEALYAGVPVVTAALGGALEIVDESCGRLVPPDDAEALAETLRRLIEDGELRRQLGANGPARAESLCNPQWQMQRLKEALAASVMQQVARIER